MAEAKILLRHPDANVRALPPKPLEFKDSKGEAQFVIPEIVGDKVVYTVPLSFARRLLANQPERYFLLEPAHLSVKRQNPVHFTTEHFVVKSIVGTKAFPTFEAPKAPVAPSKADEDKRAEEIEKAKQETIARAEEESRLALEGVSLDAPSNSGKPPEVL